MTRRRSGGTAEADEVVFEEIRAIRDGGGTCMATTPSASPLMRRWGALKSEDRGAVVRARSLSGSNDIGRMVLTP